MAKRISDIETLNRIFGENSLDAAKILLEFATDVVNKRQTTVKTLAASILPAATTTTSKEPLAKKRVIRRKLLAGPSFGSPSQKKRGRPRGSKNRVKTVTDGQYDQTVNDAEVVTQ